MENLPDIQVINKLINLGEEKIKTITHGEEEFVVIPKNCELKDFDELRENPRFCKAHPIFTGVDSFIRYFNRYANENSSIFIERGMSGQAEDRKDPTMHAILDYHEDTTAPKHGRHEATLKIRLSDEFREWKHLNDKFKTQEDFAEFVEDYAMCFLEPEAARMIEIAVSLRAKSGVDFESSKQLQNGTQTLKYKETMDAKAGETGELEIPTDLSIALKIFEGITEIDPENEEKKRATRYQVNGKFRFQIRSSSLTLKYKLFNLETVYDHAVDKLGDYVRERIDKGHVYEGTKV